MKPHLACALAIAAVLPLAACGGDGDSQSPPALSLDDIRELAGLSSPIEAAATQQERRQEISSRADSLMVSTMHIEAMLPDGIHTIRLVSTCYGPQCELLDPTTGETDTTSLGTSGIALGDAETIGSRHGITLMSVNGSHMGVERTAFGAWMENSYFSLHTDHANLDPSWHFCPTHVLYRVDVTRYFSRPVPTWHYILLDSVSSAGGSSCGGWRVPRPPPRRLRQPQRPGACPVD